eukprot:CAMPEP_0197334862 /NCGR_PEP_ID=MMETSP0892-20130614/30926_1 /TAXON_ID=44058 ORGANISM="Aureoumbra lagunensis, Strain CCMP1510" /NCGR_SAMPLE_ID=MMETSP0892 /ASSEMBLY_ACC=CAM_ASM_000538 /LENGTH=58 /DNA_ID=CAMNT_0042835775 /DNA_START=648 /DNA_END=821 /DNA_ORIENTATION=-
MKVVKQLRKSADGANQKVQEVLQKVSLLKKQNRQKFQADFGAPGQHIHQKELRLELKL